MRAKCTTHQPWSCKIVTIPYAGNVVIHFITCVTNTKNKTIKFLRIKLKCSISHSHVDVGLSVGIESVENAVAEAEDLQLKLTGETVATGLPPNWIESPEQINVSVPALIVWAWVILLDKTIDANKKKLKIILTLDSQLNFCIQSTAQQWV